MNHYENINQKTIEQFKEVTDKPYITGKALMADAHYCPNTPVGSVIVTDGMIDPAIVSADIGCGVTSTELKGEIIFNNLNSVYENVLYNLKSFDIEDKDNYSVRRILEQLKCYSKSIDPFSTFGSIGGGNHFLELGVSDKTGNMWITCHSGSRTFGGDIGNYYIKKAKELNPYMPVFHKCSEIGLEYIDAYNAAMTYATMNRAMVLSAISDELYSTRAPSKDNYNIINSPHNFLEIDKNRVIHRKGAQKLLPNQLGVIPANMKDGVFIVRGKKSEELFNNYFSAPHGAGRVMSRTEAKKTLNADDFIASMKGIISDASKELLDESPDSYKNIYDVLNMHQESIEVVDYIRPLINWKDK